MSGGPLALVIGERRLVDQQICGVGSDLHRLARRRVPGDHELAARLGAPSPARATPATVSPRCSRPKSGPGVTPSFAAGRVELSRPLVFVEDVAYAARGGQPGPRRSGTRPARARLPAPARPGRARSERGPPPGSDSAISSRRPAARRSGAGVPGSRRSNVFSSPRQAEPVVGVKVRDEHLVEVGEADRPHQLSLCALAAVEQQLLATAPHEQREAPAHGRDRAGRAGEEHREVHRRRSVSAEHDQLECRRAS